MAVGRRCAYIVDAGSAIVEIIDLGNPTTPVRAGTYKAPGRGRERNGGKHPLYLALGRGGLAIVDMSDPAAPRISASHDTPGNARVVAVADDLLLVADSDALLVLRERR